MAFSVELVRPDDLLHLHIEGDNLRIARGEDGRPQVALDDATQPGYLIVGFPPQTVVEEAVYQSSPTPPVDDPNDPDPNFNDPPASPPTIPALTRSRVGQRSRLVFRIPAGSAQRIPFSIAGLLDWDALEPSVSPLAALPPDPTREQRRNAPGIAAPARHDTAIELPYRLVLSPNAAVAWRHALEARTDRGIVELWHTRLALRESGQPPVDISRLRPAPLRAIWSPDYNASRFTSADEPKFGESDKDWPPVPILTPMTPSDRHEIVVLTSGFHGHVRDHNDRRWYAPRPIRAARLMMSALGGWLTSRGEWDPPATYRPPRWRRAEIAIEAWHDDLTAFEKAAPRRLPLTQFVRSGGDAVHGAGDPAPLAQPANAAVKRDEPDDIALRLALPLAGVAEFDLFDRFFDPREWADARGSTGVLLNVSEWSHIATLGRDHYVRIVYEGFLFPFGHRAALIKVTERKIVDDPTRGTLAHLFQRMFIVVREPLRNYRAPDVLPHLEHGGRALPFRSIRLTTLITPDIANPTESDVQLAGTKAFWVRLGSGSSPNDDFRFHAVAEDIAGHAVDFTASLVFVPFSEIGNIAAIKPAYDASGEARRCAVAGEKVTIADPAGTDNTTLETHGLYFTVQTAPVNKRFGGFLPRLFKVNVQVPAIDLMVGGNTRIDVALHDAFLQDQADNVNGLFASVVTEPSSGTLATASSTAAFQAKDAGGLATPDLKVSALTRALGPVAGTPLKAARDEFDAADFFGALASAKLFGTFPLKELIDSVTASAGAPKLQIARAPNGVTGTLHWQPKVKNAPPSPTIVEFEAKKGTTAATLKVDATIFKALDGSEPTTTISGELSNFCVTLLRVISVRFDSFTFKAEPKKKPDVNVRLDGGQPVAFLEDLSFVEELRNKLPPDLFGDGPSLDIDAKRIKAGFDIALPPVELGVFLLRDLSFGAFLELPFADGKPLLDFAFCRREKPFNLTVAFLGGGGFFHLQTDTDGVKLLEAAIEFGASASVNLGVASGGVYIMAGIYFSLQRKGTSTELSATLGGYLRMGGELSVLGLISVSLEFYLAFMYDGKAAYGIATLTVKVEVLCFSKSVKITVEKSFGGSAGDPAFELVFDKPAVWLEYAGAFA